MCGSADGCDAPAGRSRSGVKQTNILKKEGKGQLAFPSIFQYGFEVSLSHLLVLQAERIEQKEGGSMDLYIVVSQTGTYFSRLLRARKPGAV